MTAPTLLLALGRQPLSRLATADVQLRDDVIVTWHAAGFRQIDVSDSFSLSPPPLSQNGANKQASPAELRGQMFSTKCDN